MFVDSLYPYFRAETKSVEKLFESVTQTLAERYPQVLQTMRSLAERPAVKDTEDDKRMMHKLRCVCVQTI